MIEAVQPPYAVISVGENNYGHPNAEALNKLRAKGVQLFRTDEQGTIVATSDGEKITWSCSPTESWQAGEAVGMTVHITQTGTKYHTAGCEFLKDSDTEISLTKAIEQGYKPCGVCHPPK
jgi:competence protein ComEC